MLCTIVFLGNVGPVGREGPRGDQGRDGPQGRTGRTGLAGFVGDSGKTFVFSSISTFSVSFYFRRIFIIRTIQSYSRDRGAFF